MGFLSPGLSTTQLPQAWAPRSTQATHWRGSSTVTTASNSWVCVCQTQVYTLQMCRSGGHFQRRDVSIHKDVPQQTPGLMKEKPETGPESTP